MFLGPTGVGKTEIARALAEFLFDDEENLVRIDMSEYMEKHTVSRLVGAPPGYIGYEEAGQLTETVRRRPYQVILFDEIEKAHPDIFNILLQILEDGRLTDGHGRLVDFRNTIVIMTSNLGTQVLGKEVMGFQLPAKKPTEEQQLRDSVMEALKYTFRPEFLNRVDEYVIFERLSEDEIIKIVDLMVKEVAARLAEREVLIELTDKARQWLAKEGFDPNFGARPLRRAIQRHLENPLAKQVISGKFKAGDMVRIGVSSDHLTFRHKSSRAPSIASK
jgi:ATP-dependent Clp protease ATP-binding subunit ClpC